MLRLFPSTLVVAVLGLLLVGLINCGGTRDPYRYELLHGWPWVWGSQDPIENSLRRLPVEDWPARYYYRVDRAEVSDWTALLANVAVALPFVVILAGLWEWRRRCRARLLQFTLIDLLGAATVVALLCGAWSWLTDENRAYARLQNLLTAERLYDEFAERWASCDRFWSLVGVPQQHRPAFRRAVSIHYRADSPSSLPPGAIKCLCRFHRLENLTLDQVQLSLADWQELSRLRKLETISLTGKISRGYDDRKEIAGAFGCFPCLRRVNFCQLELSPPAIRDLSRCFALEEIDLTWCELQEGVTALSDLPRLRAISLEQCQHAGRALWELTALPNVTELSFYNCLPGEFTWGELAHMRQLRKLSFNNIHIDISDLEALATLPKLTHLGLVEAELTDEALIAVSRMQNLTHLDLYGNRLLTEACVVSLRELPQLQLLGVRATSLGEIAECELPSQVVVSDHYPLW